MRMGSQGVEKTVHEDTGRADTSCYKGHHAKERSEVSQGNMRLKKGGMALRKKVRETSWVDTHGHVHCVEGNAKENHGCRRRAVFVWRGMEAKVEEQAT